MLSRIADSLYWMSRYIERADGIMRMLKVNYTASLDKSSDNDFSWQPVLKLFTHLDEKQIAAMQNNTHQVLQHMIAERENPNSLLNIITQARENARGVQDHITLEVWECLNNFYHLIRQERIVNSIKRNEAIQSLDDLLYQGLFYYGTADITMPRGEGWSYMNIGKFLERALQTVDILDVKFKDDSTSFDYDNAADTSYWKYLLMSVSGYELYVKSYRTGVQSRNVIDEMVFNTNFPRSVLYSLIRLHSNFEELKSDGNRESYEKLNFLIGRVRSRVQYSTPEIIENTGMKKFIDSVRDELYEVNNTLGELYFAQQ